MGGGESWLSWVFKFVNFAVLVSVLVKFGGKPLKDYLLKRHIGIKEKIEESERMLSDAKALREKYEAKLAGVDEEISAFKKAMVEETERERMKILEEATLLASRIKEQAKLAYEQEAKEAIGRIREEIARLAVDRAEKRIVERMSKDDHERMVEDFIAKLRSLN